MNKRLAGLTLVELLVTIAIGAVLMALAIPGLGNWIQESRLTRRANDIVLGAHMARTEALKRRVPVALCLTTLSDADSGGAECVARSTPQNGDALIVFLDPERDLVAAAAADILRVVEIPDDRIKASFAPKPGTGEIPYLMFGADGFRAQDDDADGVGLTAVVLCDKRGNVLGTGGNSAARAVVISATGRPAVSRQMTEIDTIINDDVRGLGGESCTP